MNAVTQKLRALAFEQDSAILSAMLDSLLDGVIAIQVDGTIVLFNPAAERIFGYNADEVVGRHLSMLMPEPYRSDHDQYIQHYLQTGERRIIGVGREVVGLRKSGEEFTLELAVSEIPGGAEAMFVGIVRDISERTATERELSFNHEMLDSISTIQSRFIQDGDTAAAFDRLLAQILKVTDSEYGFIGEIRRAADGTTYLKTHAITNIAWNEETRRFYDENAPQGLEFFNLDTLFGAVIRSGSPVIANDPANDPRAGGIPEGHPAMHAFLGVPFYVGTRLAGMLGVANRPGGYDQELIDFLTPLTATCGNLVGALESERQRQEAETALRDANERLNSSLEEVRKQNEEIILLSELDELLQSCDSQEEAAEVVAHLSRRLFPDFCGALYTMSDDNDALEIATGWGDLQALPKFPIAHCVGMRRGRLHVSVNDVSPLRCRHIDTDHHESICIPLIGKSETFGALHLFRAHATKENGIPTHISELAAATARRISIALANLRLSESLREQSVKDPLTQLFNRRYMTETLERELHRARRDDQPLTVITIDLDHFKAVNDTFGHAAGDLVLTEFGALLRNMSRGSDVACRMGGEEFVVVLPACSLENGLERAEQIRRTMSDLRLVHDGRALGRMTFSAGVAAFPGNAGNADGLLNAADKALYRAKQNGRNRVEKAE